MIHPQYWSLYSIWCKLRGIPPCVLERYDIEAYLKLPLENAVVLDIGAYNGDTAELFLKHGARRVICIEPDQKLCLELERKHLPNVEVRCRGFNEHDLEDTLWTCCKMDCEGYEALLYERGWHKHIQGRPVVLEAHNWHIKEELEKIGFRTIKVLNPMLGLTLMANFSTVNNKKGD